MLLISGKRQGHAQSLILMSSPLMRNKNKYVNNTLRGLNFADGPFRNILRISRMGLDQIVSQILRIDKAVLETGG